MRKSLFTYILSFVLSFCVISWISGGTVSIAASQGDQVSFGNPPADITDPAGPATRPSSPPDDTEGQALSGSDGTVTLRYYCGVSAPLKGIAGDPPGDEVYKELEKKTHVKIVLDRPPEDVILEKFNLMVAAGDMPDIAEIPWSRYPGFFYMLTENGVISRLDSLIEKNAPNMNKILQTDLEARKQAMDDDGAIYRFPILNRSGNEVEYGPVIRGDLLKKYGLPVPGTIDEWEKMLKLFKERNAVRDPLTFDMSVLKKSHSFIGAFGITADFSLQYETVLYGPLEEPYKRFLSTFSRWYKTGLIDKEFPVLKNTQAVDRMIAGDAGAFIGTAEDIGAVLKAWEGADNGYELVAAPNPVLPGENKLSIAAAAWKVDPEGGAVLSEMGKHPTEAVKWLDCLFEYLYGNADASSDTGSSPQQAGESLPARYEYSEQEEAVERWSGNIDWEHLALLPPVSITREENTDVSPMMKDISTFTEESFLKTVLGVQPLEEYEKYTDKAGKMGIGEATRTMQDALDRYNNRLEAGRIKVLVDESPLKMDTQPLVFDGTAFVPVRFVVEALGGSVEWDEKERKVTAVRGDDKVTLDIGSSEAEINGARKKLEEEDLFILNGRTYVPAEFVSEALGVETGWDEDARTVSVISGAAGK